MFFVHINTLTFDSKSIKEWGNHMTNSEEKSLPKKIAEDIIAFILEENLQPEDKLPNETILCERLNVGRSSLREAMKALASRNIVTIRQGSGTYVASSTGVINDPLGLNFIKNKQKLIHDLIEIRFLHLVYNRKRIQPNG